MRIPSGRRWGAMLPALGACMLAGCGRPSQPVTAEPAASPAPLRIISLAPGLTEILVAIGAADVLVGRSSACDYPPEIVQKIPVAGGFGRPDVETVIALAPTLVVSTGLADPAVAQRLATFGVAYRPVPCDRIAELLESIETLGLLSGRLAEARALAGTLRAALAQREARPEPPHRPRVYLEIWHDPPMTCGGGTFLSELVALAGGRNIAASVSQPYFNVDAEWVVAARPDIALCAYMTATATPVDLFAGRPGWSSVPAVRRGAVFRPENPDVVLRPGPRILEGLEWIEQCLRKAADP